jgi:hypothetical protein
MNILKKIIREYWFQGFLLVVAFLTFSSFIALTYSASKETIEYKEKFSSLEKNGYEFVTELNRVPSENVLAKFCDKESQIFLYKNKVLSYSEVDKTKDIHNKKDFFCKDVR